MLLDPENQDDYVWADPAHSGQWFEDLLSPGGFESRIHEKGSRNHPLSEAAKERNSVQSAIRACVEHVFGCMTNSMGGKLTRKIGIERTETWWGLKIWHSMSFAISSAQLSPWSLPEPYQIGINLPAKSHCWRTYNLYPWCRKVFYADLRLANALNLEVLCIEIFLARTVHFLRQ